MEKSFFKIFFSKIKEREWLDKMGEDGYLLSKINDSKYFFTRSDEHKYKYSIEYLDYSPQSESAIDYYKSRESCGVKPILAAGNWVYFAATDCEFDDSPDMYKKNSVFYFWRMVYLMFFAVCGAVLCGYQAFASVYLPRTGFKSDGKFALLELNNQASGLEKILNILKEWVNGIFDFLNKYYFPLYTKIFGQSDAAIVISFLVPIVIILSVLFALNFEQFLEYRKKSKQLNSKKTEVTDAEQTI